MYSDNLPTYVWPYPWVLSLVFLTLFPPLLLMRVSTNQWVKPPFPVWIGALFYAVAKVFSLLCVDAELLPSLGRFPSVLGSFVAIPARAWSSALWRGTGQRSGKQACQSSSGVSLEQFKLLFLHLTALCQPWFTLFVHSLSVHYLIRHPVKRCKRNP